MAPPPGQTHPIREQDLSHAFPGVLWMIFVEVWSQVEAWSVEGAWSQVEVSSVEAACWAAKTEGLEAESAIQEGVDLRSSC